ncbi:MAG: A/G-specific adenine glycosylase [Pseudomonadota bacterium]
MNSSAQTIAGEHSFADRLLAWYEVAGRKDLPWQHLRTPYRVWVSEIMLQQTQVTTVIPYFERFMARFPDLEALAAAELDEVLALWTGLGYYARARNLHRTAQTAVSEHGGRLPEDPEALESLPGIGRSTANAIVAQALNRRAPILDGNVKRVLARHALVEGFPGSTAVQRRMWLVADEYTPATEAADYTQAIMDLGATLCVRRKPRCEACPVHADCGARLADRVSELPTRKPKRDKPVRAARMFVIRDPANRVLLEQRPAKGIWGGLWSPPEREADEQTRDALRTLDLVPLSEVVGPAFRHSFTHYHLDITPVFVEVDHQPPRAAEADAATCWYDPAAPDRELGLSAVAVKLLGDASTLPL